MALATAIVDRMLKRLTDHRCIKKRIRPMPGFKSFVSALATLEGIEVANMIRKGQLAPVLCPSAHFAALAS